MNIIKKIVLDIILHYDTNNPIEISKQLNLLIIESDLGNSIDVFLQQVDKHFILRVNKRKPPCPSVIAYELGHYFLHQSISHFKVSKSALFSLWR